MAAAREAFGVIPVCPELGSTRFSPVYCNYYHIFTRHF